MKANYPNSTKPNHLFATNLIILVEKLQGRRVSHLFMQDLQPFYLAKKKVLQPFLLPIELLTKMRTPLTTHVQQGPCQELEKKTYTPVRRRYKKPFP